MLHVSRAVVKCCMHHVACVTCSVITTQQCRSASYFHLLGALCSVEVTCLPHFSCLPLIASILSLTTCTCSPSVKTQQDHIAMLSAGSAALGKTQQCQQASASLPNLGPHAGVVVVALPVLLLLSPTTL